MTSETAKSYIIYNTKYEAYWRPGGGGYTSNILNAGLYTEEEARGHRPEDRAIKLVDELKRLGDWYRDDPKKNADCVGWALGVLT